MSAYRHDGSLAGVAAVANPHGALRRGFLANLTNPKAAAFFASLFVSSIPATASPWILGMIAVLLSAILLAWFCLPALMLSTSRMRRVYERVRKPIDMIIGGVLALLGIRLAIA
ncbi:MAG: LysE family transporter [Hyphomicrobiales bacterium]